MNKIEVKILNDYSDKYQKMCVPQYAYEHDAGLDIAAPKDVILESLALYKMQSGIALHLASGDFEGKVMGMIVPRSSWGIQGLTVANTCGIIDQGYQGEIIVYLRNVSNVPLYIHKGDRIVQLIILPVKHVECTLVEQFSLPSARNTKGFGSSDDNT